MRISLTQAGLDVLVLFMADAARMAEAQEQALGIFADALLKLALDVQQLALATGDVDQKVKLAGAFHRLGRGLRQTVALQARIGRDARKEASEPKPRAVPAPAAPADPKTLAARRRRDWLTRGVERCVWNEYERDDEAAEFTGDSLLEDLSERLADLMADPEAFLALDPDELLIQLCKDLGLTPPQFHPPPPMVPAANGHDSQPADSS